MATPISSRTGFESFPSLSVSPPSWPAAAFEKSPASQLDRHPGETRILAMEVAGSGRADLVQIWTAADGRLHATTYLAEPAPGGVTYRRGEETLLGSFGGQYQVLQGDLDGDGRADLLVAYASGPGRELRLAAFLSQDSGFAEAGIFATGQAWSPRHIAFHLADTSGDGRADLVEIYERTDPARGGLLTFRTWRSLFGAGKTFGDGVASRLPDAVRPAGEVLGLWPLATRGKGVADLVRVRRRAADDHLIVETYRAQATPGGTPFAPALVSDLGAFPLANQLAFHPLDLDGDGVADLVQVWSEISPGGTRLHLSTFFGDGDGRFAAGPDSVFADTAALPFFALDARGGSPSLVGKWISSAGRLMLTRFHASPAGVFKKARPCDAGPAGPGVASATYLVADADGDGRDDLVRLRLGAPEQLEALPYLCSGVAPERGAAEYPANLTIFRTDPSGSRPAGSAAGG